MATEIPAGKVKFSVRGTEFSIDLIEALDQIQHIRERRKDQEGFEHLTDFAEWLKSQAKTDVTRGEADWLWDELQSVYIEKKQQRQASRGLPPITPVSTSSDSAQK